MNNDVRSLRVQYPSRRSFLSSARAEGSALTLFVPVETSVRTSERVRLEVHIEGVEQDLVVVGKVASMLQPRTAAKEAGFGVEIENEFKRDAAGWIARCAGKSPALGTAYTERFPANIQCTIRSGEEKVKAKVADLSLGGAFITPLAATKIRVGSEVQVHLEPGLLGLGGTRIDARVIWRGMKGDLQGFGARFTGDGLRVQSAVRKYLG
jgi:Tfp pilus assembly protein PilZ